MGSVAGLQRKKEDRIKTIATQHANLGLQTKQSLRAKTDDRVNRAKKLKSNLEQQEPGRVSVCPHAGYVMTKTHRVV